MGEYSQITVKRDNKRYMVRASLLGQAVVLELALLLKGEFSVINLFSHFLFHQPLQFLELLAILLLRFREFIGEQHQFLQSA